MILTPVGDQAANPSSSASSAASPRKPHQKDLLDQFYLTLRSIHAAAGKGVPDVQNIQAKLEELLTLEHTWQSAYEIEQLLCFVMTPSQLDIELTRRIQDAKALKSPFSEFVETEIKKPPPGVPIEAKRILLHRLLNDLQWFYSKREEHRATSKRLMYRVSSLFGVALVALFLVLFIQFFAQPLPPVQ